MPYVVKAKRRNFTISVLISSVDQDESVILRNDDEAVSYAITPDMRAQKKMDYIDYEFVEKFETPVKEVVESTQDETPVKEVVESTQDETPVDVPDSPGETQPIPPSEDSSADILHAEFYTDEELKKLHKAELKALAEAHPNTKVDPSLNKSELLEGLLKFDIPKGE